MTPFHQLFYPIFGTGLAVATIAAIVAGASRGILLPVVALIVGLLSAWAGLFIGSEVGFRAWQSMPDPPPEAFADTMPMGALLFGWMPAGIYCSFLFGVARLLRLLLTFRSGSVQTESSDRHALSNAVPTETGNPFQSPPASRRG